MPLIDCPECHHSVGMTAKSCPNCGARIDPYYAHNFGREQWSTGKSLLCVLLLIAIGMVIIFNFIVPIHY